ncbi:acyltransferase family protein [Hydrogenophaga sp. 5NK40-0174]|uniref:acyltransferase family protein n=1 Tax=Hydrogenophaga sp. 5NK40-0174 TaxID=3127649 RepID=UPI00310690AB
MSSTTTQATPQSTGRITWIDSAKGLGIALIVLGHITSVSDPSALYVYIYAFHVPLFFFISGLTLKPGRHGFGHMLAAKAKTLLLPYFVYAMLGYAFYLAGYLAALKLNLQLEQFRYGLWPPLLGVFYGSLGDGHLVNAPVWFIVSLFCAFVMGWAINTWIRLTVVRWAFVAVIAAIGYWVSREIKLPWSLGPAMVGLVFLQGGFEYAQNMRRQASKVSLWIGFGLLVAGSFFAMSNGFVTLAEVVLGNPARYLAHGFIGLFMVIYFCRALGERGQWLAWLGQYSMAIMVIHMLIIKSMKVVLAFALHTSIAEIEANWVLSAGVLLATCVALVPAVFIMERFLPFTLGSASAQRSKSAGRAAPASA